jgi:hypothetical protein
MPDDIAFAPPAETLTTESALNITLRVRFGALPPPSGRWLRL